ncbi:MAG: TonB-dependent receptor [Bacteroidales bacterium]|nr:TonB-dependent receptor [Bacteroidales bacterium]
MHAGLSRQDEKWATRATVGLVRDFQLYKSTDTIATNRLVATLENEVKLTPSLELNLGLDYEYIKPEVHAYKRGLEERRVDGFVFLAWKATSSTRVSANYRQALVTGYRPAFAPSLGVDQIIFSDGHRLLINKFSISRSYKIPTFNDRFWINAGVDSLKTEKGSNIENTLKFSYCKGSTTFESTLTGYAMLVDDWIEWREVSPSVWRPRNNQQVYSRGMETSVQFTGKPAPFSPTVNVSYSLNRSTIKKIYEPGDSLELGKQLRYSPVNTLNIFYEFGYKGLRTGTRFHLVGERWVDNAVKVAGYQLVDLSVSKKIKIKESSLLVYTAINNLLNKAYENTYNYAMPGRNYQISVQYYF